MKPLIVSNRGPIKQVGEAFEFSSGGLATALHSLLSEMGGTWIWQEEPAVFAEAAAKGAIPDAYACGVADVPSSARQGFYEGVSNAVLWPLLHSFPSTSTISEAPWADYVLANQVYEKATRKYVDPDSLIWIHDYHLMLLPRMLRESAVGNPIGWFCHIPWPGVDVFEILPWREQLLEGLLGADVVGFHTSRYARNFMDCARQLLGADVNREAGAVTYEGHVTQVTVAPIGVDTQEFRQLGGSARCVAQREELRDALGGRRILLGVDRLDYTKGILERIKGFARWLERHPERRQEVVLVQVMVPSRTGVAAYAALKDEIDALVGKVNGAFGMTGSVPIHYLYRGLEREDLVAHYTAADVALVTPLRDGMNLIAHEYVASRPNGDGALILSEFAGASEHFPTALKVNPYDLHGIARAITTALDMSQAEQRARMDRLWGQVQRLDVKRWAAGFISSMQERMAREVAESGIRRRPLVAQAGMR